MTCVQGPSAKRPSPTISLDKISLSDSKKNSKPSIKTMTKKAPDVCCDRMCSKCDEDKPSSEFYKGRNQCKDCLKKARKLSGSKKKDEIARLKQLVKDLNEVAADAISIAKKTVDRKLSPIEKIKEEKFFQDAREKIKQAEKRRKQDLDKVSKVIDNIDRQQFLQDTKG